MGDAALSATDPPPSDEASEKTKRRPSQSSLWGAGVSADRTDSECPTVDSSSSALLSNSVPRSALCEALTSNSSVDGGRGTVAEAGRFEAVSTRFARRRNGEPAAKTVTNETFCLTMGNAASFSFDNP
jgi:hypothetical protein